MSDHAETVRNYYRRQGAETERQRIIRYLLSRNVIRPSMIHPGQYVGMDAWGNTGPGIDLIMESENQ